LKTNKLRLVGADAHQGTLWGRDALHGGVALCLGNEARGLSSELSTLVKAWVRLPVHGKAESLNVAVAGGVLMYLWRKENIDIT
jgi:TrmH family RNA methyltransferase